MIVSVLCYSEKGQAPRTSRWVPLYRQTLLILWLFTAFVQFSHTLSYHSNVTQFQHKHWFHPEFWRTGSCRAASRVLNISGVQIIFCGSCGIVNLALRQQKLCTTTLLSIFFGNLPHVLIFSCRLISEILAGHWKRGLILHYVILCPSTPDCAQVSPDQWLLSPNPLLLHLNKSLWCSASRLPLSPVTFRAWAGGSVGRGVTVTLDLLVYSHSQSLTYPELTDLIG